MSEHKTFKTCLEAVVQSGAPVEEITEALGGISRAYPAAEAPTDAHAYLLRCPLYNCGVERFVMFDEPTSTDSDTYFQTFDEAPNALPCLRGLRFATTTRWSWDGPFQDGSGNGTDDTPPPSTPPRGGLAA